ncbi:DUF302 domain-containing protein [Sulfurimonas sp.]|uniref:DUF302 domain-containing protein n=1 Tax=Sulfurimonas sp. TaxID=2022749 RepID=UPI002603D263|nr:DUF302 domain-containing protein [Sulfurimonas sp.]
MKKLLTVVIALLSAVVLQAKGDLHLFAVDNANGKITPQTIAKAFESNGFMIALNNDMTRPFKIQFKKSDFEIFTLMTVYEPKLDYKLLKIDAKAGVFVPMGVGIYQRNGEKTLHVSILTSDAQAKIIGIKSNDVLKQIEAKALKSLEEALPKAKQTMSEDSLKESRNLVTTYVYELDGDDADEARDELKMNLEGGFAPKGFIMPATMDFDNDILDDDPKNPFEFYESYSICKLPVIYTVAKSRPEAAAFAPCTLMVYKKKDEDKIVLGFPAVYNWLSSAKVEDEAAKKELLKAQKDFESILKDVTE